MPLNVMGACWEDWYIGEKSGGSDTHSSVRFRRATSFVDRLAMPVLELRYSASAHREALMDLSDTACSFA